MLRAATRDMPPSLRCAAALRPLLRLYVWSVRHGGGCRVGWPRPVPSALLSLPRVRAQVRRGSRVQDALPAVQARVRDALRAQPLPQHVCGAVPAVR
jgi:hypothetical protein